MRLTIFLFLFVIAACTPKTEVSKGSTEAHVVRSLENTTVVAQAKRPKNVILMIGDGMGITQISAGMYMNENYIALERMPVVGLHKSYSSSSLVTDSAAGATAFSCGEKTYNGAIGVDKDTTAIETIFEFVENKGFNTGLVATSTIVHATPASFYAHEASRRSYENIAKQLVESEVDFFIGGGQQFFDKREDKRDLLKELQNKGWQVESYFDKTINEITPQISSPFAYLTALDDPLPVLQGRDYLLPASEMAIDYLNQKDQNKNGFMLMIEGSQIDWGGHANKSDYIISEVIDFSQTIDKVLDFAEKDGNTLVVITADHETGGYAIQNGSKMDSIVGAFTSDYHTADLIPVFAYGPGAENFSGIYQNTDIHDKIKALVE